MVPLPFIFGGMIITSDLHGNTHEVILTPGDVLFYESSKCLHGRPKIFNGKAYSSIFIHYYPSRGWDDTDKHMEGHYAIPAGWNKNIAPAQSNTYIKDLKVSLT